MKDNLENYYLSDESWKKFTILYEKNIFPDKNNFDDLVNTLDNDIVLAKVIRSIVGESAQEWVMKKIPALDNLRPIDCIKSPQFLKRLRTMLMRM